MPAPMLVLGGMPPGASPDTHLAAGPWCFAGREELFPDWEKLFTFAPEPFADPALLQKAAKAAQILCARMMPDIAGLLSGNQAALPPAYWQTLLCPWLIDVAKQIVERGLRCAAMLKVWGADALRVPVPAENQDFDFLDEHDFTLRGALGVHFNHWLFARLLAPHWPAAWEKLPADYPQERRKPSVGRAKGLGEKARRKIRALQLHLPFPRLKGMSVPQALQFSLALNHDCRQADHSIDLYEFGKEAWPEEIPVPGDVSDIFRACLPQSLKRLRHKAVERDKGSKARVASIIAYEDARYRQKLAYWRARGNRLAYVQHGGNYGQVRVACDTELVEYSQDAFFTWGWKTHGRSKGNFIPLPYPQLENIANKWRPPEDGKLLFVGTEMAAWPYRLDSRPTPLQFLQYRQDKAVFFRNLGPELTGRSLYRPYFDLPGVLPDAAWLMPRFQNLSLCRGPLLPQLLNCHLLILDHHGTTMLEAMVADVPMILYWNRSHWQLAEDCEDLLDMLAQCGIWHDNPADAAQKAREVWANPAKWWNSAPIRLARLAFCANQAVTSHGNIDRQWINALKQL